MSEKHEGVLLAPEPDAPFLEVDELRTLVAEGRERGFLTFEEIASFLEEVDVTKEQVRDLHLHLLDAGVEIISSESREGPAAPPVPDAPAAQAKRPEIDLTVEPSLDSLRLYLRSIGRVDLLTADEEVTLAKRIERGDMIAKQQMI